MADDPKPYRVYRGGRAKGKVPSFPRPEREKKEKKAAGGPGYRGPGPARKPKSRWRYARWIGLLLVLFLLWAIAWGVAGYFSVRDGVHQANKRVPVSVKRQLTKQDGILFDTSTTILLLGTDHSANKSRSGDQHSDSIMLVRTDPSRHRIFYLSIPRDLLVQIPGYGQQKINAAFQFGGPRLALQTIKTLTNVQINHVVVVDFARFKELIDAIGGVDINVKKPIVSNSFDCPYSAARCASFKGYRFGKGWQHMNGQRALIFSRIRENRLDPSENDLTRAERQQQVVQAVLGKLASFGTFLDAPFHGSDLLKPIATDMTTGQFLGLAWVKFRAGTQIHCRLGGQLTGNGSALQSLEENRNVIDEFEGTSAVQPPAPVSGSVLPAGCVTGDKSIVSK